MDTLDSLKNSLEDLRSWLKIDLDELDPSKRRKIELVRQKLAAIKTEPAPATALTWSYGTLLLAHFDNEIISSSTCQKILSTFVKSLSSTQVTINDLSNLWKLLSTTDCVKGLIQVSPKDGSCLYKNFLTVCLQNLGKSDICDAMFKFVLDSCDPCLINGLLKQHKKHEVLYEVLDILLVQLVAPFCDKAQDTARAVLKSCGWKIGDSIREMLNGALISDKESMAPFASHQDVYEIIFELMLINKDLVLGLINNTELCLTTAREDRLRGFEFFCKLFGADCIPGVPKPTELYSHLWQTFLSHCRNTSLLEPSELMVIGKYTSTILNHPDTQTHEAWCELLFYLLEYRLPPPCTMALLSGITTAVKHNLSLLLKSGPKSLPHLIKNLLDPCSDYARSGKVRYQLIKDLSEIYCDATKTATWNMRLPTFHEASAWILSCLLSTCDTLCTTNENWCLLRKLFVKKLVPFNMEDEDRMKMFFNLWVNTNLEDWSILHELFLKTRQVRQIFIAILDIIRTRENYQNGKSRFRKLWYSLYPFLISGKTSPNEFVAKQFLPVLENTPELKNLLYGLLFDRNSCGKNVEIIARIRHLFSTRNNIDMKVLDGLLYYLCEITFDASSMKHLVTLVDSCVIGESISSAMGEKRLHIARTSLRLLSEAIFMEPKLGLHIDVLNSILKWSTVLNGSLSMLALRCVTCLSSKGDLCAWPLADCDEYMKETMLPVWFKIIRLGSRGQVKMAIRCVAFYSTISHDDQYLGQVFKIISNNLKHPISSEAFECGVSALGHFAAVCPSALKKHVSLSCMSVLLKSVVVERLFRQNTLLSADSVASASSSETWVDWEELPQPISLTIQAMRSIGKCMRYCGTHQYCILFVLLTFEQILRGDYAMWCHLREVDKDQLRCEAAKASLHILEFSEDKAQLPSDTCKRMILLLSHVLTDPCVEVRHIFAEKLVQGLCAYKRRSCKIGRSRGSLPSCMLGLLVLFGSEVWMETPESEAVAEAMLKEVCFSRVHGLRMAANPHPINFENSPHLVLEIIFVAAVPIIAEHSLFQAWSFSEEPFWKENEHLALRVSECFNFLRKVVFSEESYGGQVSKLFIQNMLDEAKQSIFSTIEPAKSKKYTVVFELLEISLRLYEPARTQPPTPRVKLPPPFYTATVLHEPMNQVAILSEADANEILKHFRRAARKRKLVIDKSTQEHDEVWLDETEPDAQEDDSSFAFSSDQSLSDISVPFHHFHSEDPPSETSGYSQFGRPTVHSTPASTKRRRR